jgi:CubicO group peptidase (beta-lactamase class C family)
MKMLFSFFCLIIFSCGIGQHNSNDGIDTSTLSEVGMNTRVIDDITTKITSGFYPNIHSLLIYKNDKLVYENYFAGNDQLRGEDLGTIEHSAEDLHDVRSISKCVVSACIGIAIDQGKIKSVDEKVFGFFCEYTEFNTGMKKQLTIKHLLTMSAGLEWNENVPYNDPSNSETQMDNSEDKIKFILSRNSIAQPGREWKYNGGTTELLAAILEKSTGKKIDEFAEEFLFKPLGIEEFEWMKFHGTDKPIAASGLRLRSRDLLKFGVLYFQKGKWNNKQIISENWINQSFQNVIARPQSTKNVNGGYGYQFWVYNDTIHNDSLNIVAAVGNGDQRIYFEKKNNLMVVITAGNYNVWGIKNNSYAILRRIYEAMPSK